MEEKKKSFRDCYAESQLLESAFMHCIAEDDGLSSSEAEKTFHYVAGKVEGALAFWVEAPARYVANKLELLD